MDGRETDTVDSILAFGREKGATFSIGQNGTPTDIVSQYKVSGYPTNVVIDREGHIVSKIVGMDLAKLQAALAKAGFQ